MDTVIAKIRCSKLAILVVNTITDYVPITIGYATLFTEITCNAWVLASTFVD